MLRKIKKTTGLAAKAALGLKKKLGLKKRGRKPKAPAPELLIKDPEPLRDEVTWTDVNLEKMQTEAKSPEEEGIAQDFDDYYQRQESTDLPHWCHLHHLQKPDA